MRTLIHTLAALACTPAAGDAQCGEWSKAFQNPGLSDTALVLFDSDVGGASAVYVGGSFVSAGGVIVNRIAKWDGTACSPLGTGMNSTVYALCEFDTGGGDELYAGGSFSIAGGVFAPRVAHWNGTSWAPLGPAWSVSSGEVRALASFDDSTGGGEQLFAGGTFTTSGGISFIAKWNGSAPVALGSGLNGAVRALCVFDDGLGGGPKLYAGGAFTTAGGNGANAIARWDGAAWSPLASGVTGGQVSCLQVFDDGAGPALYAGGTFTHAGPTLVNYVAKWDGASWSAVGGGVTHSSMPAQASVDALAVFDVGGVQELAAGGDFTHAGGLDVARVARWNGTSWSAMASGASARVHALTSSGGGAQASLFAGGAFTTAGAANANRIARWDGTAWSALGNGASAQVNAFQAYQSPLDAEVALYTGGSFTSIGGVAVNRLAKWDGKRWSSVGSGADNNVHSFSVWDDGSGTGPALFVGGGFNTIGGVTASRIARWDGTNWTALGVGTSGAPNALTVFDDGSGSGPALYVGGSFTSAGGFLCNNIARWNGTSWSFMPGVNQQIRALVVFDSGSGPALYAGGYFTNANAMPVNFIAKWNGTSWSGLGTGTLGTNEIVTSLALWDDGNGEALYAGGYFTTAGGVSALHVAKWDGASWSAVGGGIQGIVTALGVFDDGSGDGPALIAAGDFSLAGGVSANRIAKWNGSAWSPLGGGLNNTTQAMASFHDGSATGPDLYIGGLITTAGSAPSSFVAQWLGCGAPGVSYCFGDGLDPAVTAQCVCSNFGGENRGCANSNPTLGGAKLSGSGTTSPNTVLLVCEGMPNNTLCTFLRSATSVASGTVYGDGVRCLTGNALRFGQQFAGQNGHPPHTVSTGVATAPAGSTRYYQCYYRNPSGAFCPPGLFNVSNAYSIEW